MHCGLPVLLLVIAGALAGCGESAWTEPGNDEAAPEAVSSAPAGEPPRRAERGAPDVQRASPTPGASAGVPPPDANTDPGDIPDTSAPNEDGVARLAAGVTARYACESGHRVDIVRGEVARVTLADGRVVHLRRSDETPPRYRGEALSFEVHGNGATLGQHEVGGFDCQPVE